MSEGWDEYAEGWDINDDVVLYSEKAFESLLSVVNLNGLRVLDFGCGTGLLTKKIFPFAKEIVALDTSKKMVSFLSAKKLPNVMTLSAGLTEDLIRESELFSTKFDLVIASSVCSFLPEYEQTLALLKSTLVSGGKFVQWDWLASDGDSEFGLSRERIASVYDKVGLKLESLAQVFSIKGTEGDMPVLM